MHKRIPRNCLRCEKPYMALEYRVRLGFGMHCSNSCALKKDFVLEKEFWKRVKKTKTCWLWTGCKDADRGRLSVNGSWVDAHRISYVLHFGSVPYGVVIGHKCRNKHCVRPDHLFPDTIERYYSEIQSKYNSAFVASLVDDGIGDKCRYPHCPERITRTGYAHNRIYLLCTRHRRNLKMARRRRRVAYAQGGV